jgi:hypothetical protein
MTSLGELYEFIRRRKRYWLLPFFIPILAFYALVIASKAVMNALQNLPSAGSVLFRKSQSGLVVNWARTHLRYSRHP